MEFRRGPILGSLVTIAAGAVIVVVPFRFQSLLSAIGGGNTTAGILIGGLIICCGIGAFIRGDFSTELGILAMVLSVLSLFGAFGGLLVGLILGIIGGSLCMSWQPSP